MFYIVPVNATHVDLSLTPYTTEEHALKDAMVRSKRKGQHYIIMEMKYGMTTEPNPIKL